MIYLKEGRTPLNFAYSDEIVHDGNSTYQLSFKFPTNNPLWEELVEETLLLADDLHGEQEFIIFEVEKHHAYITVHANQVATLLNNYSITELSVNNASGDRVMRSLVGSIIREHKFTFSSDIASTHSINLKNVTVATALFKDKHSILGQWGGDLIRDKYDIRLLSNGGTNKEALFMYKKNLKTYQQKKSIKDLRTRIHFTKTISSQKEGEKDKVIAVTVDSPLISKYKNIYEGNLDVSDQDVIDEVTLRKYGEQYFKTTLCDVIEESIEIDVVGNPDVPVNIFDTVTVFHEKFNLDVKKKITKYTYTPMGRKLKTIGFGKIQQGLGTTLASMIDDAVTEHVESKVDAFKIQKNLSELLKLDRKGIEDKLVELEERSNSALEVKRALFEADGNIPDVVKTKILDAVEAEVGRLKTIITEAELIKAIQAKLDYAEIKNTLIDKAFINQIISDERFTQQFKDGEVTTQNIFTKLKDSIKSNISKDFVTKEGVKKLVNDLTIDADGIRQITQQESEKVFEKKKVELKGVDSYIHKKYSEYADGRDMSDNSTLKYIGIYTGDKQQAPTNASEYSWTKIKVDGKLYKAYSNNLNGIDFTLVEPDENAKLFAKNRPRVNIVNDNDISDIWQANMFLSFKPNTKYTLTARAKGNSNKLWAYFRNNRTSEEYSWGQLEFRGLETKSITFTTTNDVNDVLFKFVLVPEDEDWTGIQIDWFTIYEGDKRYADYPVDEPAQYHKYRYFGYVFKEGTPVASDFEWFDLQQTSITNDKYTHIVYSDNADGSNFGREPKKYMGVARTTSPTQPTDKTAYKWFKVKGEDGRDGADGADGKSIKENLLPNSNFAKELENWEMARLNNSGLNWQKGHAIDNFGRGLHIWGTPNGEYKGLGTVPFNLIAKQGEKLTLSMDLGKDALT
jgi:phage minor structural protein